MNLNYKVYKVRRPFPMPFNGRKYAAGDLISSKDIGSAHKESKLVSLLWIEEDIDATIKERVARMAAQSSAQPKDMTAASDDKKEEVAPTKGRWNKRHDAV